MNPRDVHPLCHLWPPCTEWRMARLTGEKPELMRRQARNKRKKWRQKRKARR